MTEIVMVEDDHMQEGPLAEALEELAPDLSVTVIANEEEFYSYLLKDPGIVPEVFVIDLMLRWAYPRPNAAPPPPEVLEGGFQRAGMRCVRKLRADPRYRHVPRILYTIVERSDLESSGQSLDSGTQFVRKSPDGDTLLRAVRVALLGGRSAR